MASEAAERVVDAQSSCDSDEDVLSGRCGDAVAVAGRRAVRKARTENRRAVTRFKNDLIIELRARVFQLEEACKVAHGPDAAAGVGLPLRAEAEPSAHHDHAEEWLETFDNGTIQAVENLEVDVEPRDTELAETDFYDISGTCSTDAQTDLSFHGRDWAMVVNGRESAILGLVSMADAEITAHNECRNTVAALLEQHVELEEQELAFSVDHNDVIPPELFDCQEPICHVKEALDTFQGLAHRFAAVPVAFELRGAGDAPEDLHGLAGRFILVQIDECADSEAAIGLSWWQPASDWLLYFDFDKWLIDDLHSGKLASADEALMRCSILGDPNSWEVCNPRGEWESIAVSMIEVAPTDLEMREFREQLKCSAGDPPKASHKRRKKKKRGR